MNVEVAKTGVVEIDETRLTGGHKRTAEDNLMLPKVLKR